MTLSEGLITALGGVIVLLIGAYVKARIDLRHSLSSDRKSRTDTEIKAAGAKQKREHADFDAALQVRDDLIDTLRVWVGELQNKLDQVQTSALEKYDAVQRENMECHARLAALKAQFDDFKEWQKRGA